MIKLGKNKYNKRNFYLCKNYPYCDTIQIIVFNFFIFTKKFCKFNCFFKIKILDHTN